MFHDMGWGGMWFGWFFWLAVLVIVIWIGIKITKNSGKQNSNQIETPLDILKKRYAKGEISKEEFEQMKRGIQS
jgi:putative membrane protein